MKHLTLILMLETFSSFLLFLQNIRNLILLIFQFSFDSLCGQQIGIVSGPSYQISIWKNFIVVASAAVENVPNITSFSHFGLSQTIMSSNSTREILVQIMSSWPLLIIIFLLQTHCTFRERFHSSTGKDYKVPSFFCCRLSLDKDVWRMQKLLWRFFL